MREVFEEIFESMPIALKITMGTILTIMIFLLIWAIASGHKLQQISNETKGTHETLSTDRIIETYPPISLQQTIQ